MRIDEGVNAREERLQRLAGPPFEVDGEEVVEEDVGDDAGIMTLLGNEDAAEGGDARVRVGEGIDGAMIADAVGDRRRKAIAEAALHEIAGEIADQRLGRLIGEKQVGEEVHARF